MEKPLRKAYYPLESNPDVFNELIGLLGVSPQLAFEDVFSLEDPEFLPHPALALVLVFPADVLEKEYAASTAVEYTGSGDDEPTIWFKQTIHNACGLYAVLHALCNGEAARYIEPNSLLSNLRNAFINLPPNGRAQVLESSAELGKAHTTVALKGDSEVPDRPDAEVDFHYICYIRSEKDCHVYELDGDRKGPHDTGLVLAEGQDIVCEEALALVRKYVADAGGNVNFSLLALVKRDSG